MPGHDAAHVEQVVDQLHLRARVALDDLEAALEVRGLGAAPRLRSIWVQPRIALSGVRSSCESVARNSSLIRVAALRRDARAALGLEDRLALRAARLQGLGALSLGQVARDLAKPSRRPARRASAVMMTLAQNREPSLRTRQPSSSKRPSAVATCSSCSGQPLSTASCGIEAREVLADDLVGAVALDALGAGVPGRDVAVGVEHEDRVVLDALDQQAEALLALPQRLLVLAPLGQVAGDFREADAACPSGRAAR